MTTIKITTSMTTTIVSIPSPVDEVFEIRYRDCLYCGAPFRDCGRDDRHKFHSTVCRVLYFKHDIASCETVNRSTVPLSVCR